LFVNKQAESQQTDRVSSYMLTNVILHLISHCRIPIFRAFWARTTRLNLRGLCLKERKNGKCD